MSIREVLRMILEGYPKASREPLAGHPLAAYISGRAPTEIELAAGTSDLLFKASPGKGNWAAIPWIAAFEPSITTSATKGYYVVYLFNIKHSTVALSLNQGTTAALEEFGASYTRILSERASLVRERISDFLGVLPDIEIGNLGKSTLARGYQSGHAIGKTYNLATLPSEEELAADLRAAFEAYRALRFRGGLDFSEEDAAPPEGKNGSILERRRYGSHKRLERSSGISRKVKAVQGHRCRGCDVDFKERLGDVGLACIEAHHLFPIHMIEQGAEMRYDFERDFAVLCANCHRLVHQLADTSDIDYLRSIVKRI